jgi:hypothetical protein
MKSRVPLITALLLGLVLVSSVGAAVTRESTQPFRITSSIDGKKVLRIKSRWLAYPKVPSAKVAEVDFLIDGKLRCVEHYAPYNFGSDDLHGHFGWLFTTWLTPDKHRFTARATLINGKKASDTVVARVLPAPEPPSALAGRWQRTVTEEEVAKVDPSSAGDLPTGKWALVFDHIGAWSLDPKGSGVVDHANIHAKTLVVDGAISMWPYGAGHGKLNRYGHSDIGAGWREDGPPGSYRWSVSGNKLTLTAIKETSGPFLVRRAVWDGTWTRVP